MLEYICIIVSIRGKCMSIQIKNEVCLDEAVMPSSATYEPCSDKEDVAISSFDVKTKYDDAFYDNYVNNFVKNTKKRYFYKFVKRSFDFIFSLIALLLLSPLFLVVAIAIKIDSKGPVFFKQKRVGKNYKEFTCYKFRSMSVEAPHYTATSNLENRECYITKVGKVIRKLSIDELPQLWCVLVNDMSLLGYRPLLLNEASCNDMRDKMGVFEFKPGISGYAQVLGRDFVYYKNKAILDAEYVKKASIWLDIKLFFKTILVVFTKSGNDS